ncbi:MAG: CPCC family cysteine-rich protein [Planctomycetota bacterium]
MAGFRGCDVPKFPCPCCGYLTLPEKPPGSLEICHVCFWQDDGVGFLEPSDAVGANAVSLEDARASFREWGACERRFVECVRPPTDEEAPPFPAD